MSLLPLYIVRDQFQHKNVLRVTEREYFNPVAGRESSVGLLNAPFSPNYFIFMANLKKSWSHSSIEPHFAHILNFWIRQ